MNKLKSLLWAVILMPLAACADNFKAGEHYEVLSKPATAKPEVKEFFSFYCPHCFSFEPIMDDIKKSLPADAKFVKSHVDFMPRNNREVAEGLGKSLAALELLKKEEDGVAVLFKHLHVDRKSFNSMNDVRSVLIQKADIEPSKYDNAYNNFMTAGRAKQMSNEQKSYKITSVPTLVINGKFKVKAGSVKSEKEYVELVNYLLKQK
ncbi:thiol:disulfide interchange protein DsbA/DsbL [Gayadomonas joobiniege]|uniref:thiol:disulfide interchange protein DsbA/DsbL n=1 Tax=Gayadomonas joobiniege TaxID=1234606 RepID=UPI000364B1A5|nr:thiol:disulfide interchange protein DsbA/DsbL [Gayadomonas joobiniege]